MVEEKTLAVSKSITINAAVDKVWQALTEPELIKQYLFGTNTVTDWKVGSPIRFYGEWQGKTYEDKGTIQDLQPMKLLHYTYWSSMSGIEDRPENYYNVKFTIQQKAKQTILTVFQDGATTEEARKHMEDNWEYVIKGIKSVAEGL